MSRRDKILAQYEESLFTLLMSEAAEWEGGRLLEEMERLSRDPAAAVPEAVSERCRRTLRREFSRKRAAKFRRSLGRGLKAALAAAKRCSYHELWCVFQPHTYTRTKAFLHEFAAALSAADHVILADIYPARETDTLGVSSEDIHRLLVKMGVDSHYLPTFRQIEKFVLDICQPGDMLITMGAGDVVKVGEDLLKN